MLSDFENLNNANNSDDIEDNTLKNSGLFENLSDELQKSDTLSENIYAFLESLDKEYFYKKQELSGGIVKESVTWNTDSDIIRNADSIYNLDKAKDTWRMQESGDNAMINCQKFILDEYSGGKTDNFAEDDLIDTLNDDVYSEYAGNLLEYYGIDTHIEYDADFRTLENALDAGNRVIVRVNSLSLNNNYAGVYPVWNADHAVEIIGIDKCVPDKVKVIINDPSTEDGCGKTVDYDMFINAWDMSDNFMMTAERP